MKKCHLTIIITSVVALSLFGATAAFSASEAPYYAASGVEPNILIILDRSGSMARDVGGGGADTDCSSPTYPNPLSATGDYSRICIARQVLFDLLDANNNNAINTEDQTYLGVRLGYGRFIHVPRSPATGASEGAAPAYANGSISVINDIGTAYTTLWDNINSLSTGGYTPLGTALSEALSYFQNAASITGDTCKSCRKNYVILVTDGADTVTCAAGDESAANRRATVYAANALRDAGVNVFIVGFGGDLSATLQRTLNWAAFYGGTDNLAAANSGSTAAISPADLGSALCDATAAVDPGSQALSGYAFLATNASELASAIKQAIDEARTGSYTRSQPVLTASGDKIYAGFFDLPGWKGHLNAWNVDAATGDIEFLGSTFSYCSASPASNPYNALYDAGTTLTNSSCTGYVAPSARKIYTAVGAPIPSRIWLNVSSGSAAYDNTNMTNSGQQQGDLCAALNITGFNCNANYASPDTSNPDGNANELINFIRFSSTTFNGSGGTRDAGSTSSPQWRFGDVWHSTPTIVGPPKGVFNSAGYGNFKTNNIARQQVIIVGANDGMLHAFDDNGAGARGKELWAFISNNLLGKLQSLSLGHDFYVDSSPTAADVCLDASNCGKGTEDAAHWKTVVISGERDGGRAYFALDITDTANPKYLWQFTDNNLGNTWSKPAIGKVRIKNGGNYEDHWAAFFGGGTSTTDDVGNRFYVVDIATGGLLGSGANATKFIIGASTNKIPGAPRPIDTDGDYYVDSVFFGDAEGILYKLDVTNTNPNNWSVSKIFDPSLSHKAVSCDGGGNQTITQHPANEHEKRPIYYTPAIAINSDLKPLIMFGTGFVDDYINPSGTTIQNYFYVLRLEDDAHTGASPSNAYVTELFSQSLDQGERMVTAPIVYGGYAYYGTYTPAAVDVCSCDVGSSDIRWVKLESCGILGSSGTIEAGSGIVQFTYANERLYTITSQNQEPDDPCKKLGANCPKPEGVDAAVIYWRERSIDR